MQHVAVEEQRHAAVDDVAAPGDGAGLDEAMAVQAVVDWLVAHVAHLFDPVRLRGRHEVVQQRRSAGEALHAE